MPRIQIFILTALAAGFGSAAVQAEDYPEAKATAEPNVVESPYPPNKKVDITGFLPGDLARDPHTNKVFRVPARKATPMVFKPEIIEDDPVSPPTLPVSPETIREIDGLPVRIPEIVEEPDSAGPREIARPPAVPDTLPVPEPPAVVEVPGSEPPMETGPVPPGGIGTAPLELEETPGVSNSVTPGVIEPEIPTVPARAAREIDDALTDFVKVFVRSGQADDPQAQVQYLAPVLSQYYSIPDATIAQVVAAREEQIARWPRRIYVVSGKPRFIRWISEVGAEDEFVIDVRVYQSLKRADGKADRGYADHRLSIREKAEGGFEIIGTEERHPRSVLAGQ